MRPTNQRLRHCLLVAGGVSLLVFALGCSVSRSTPPGASTITSSTSGMSFTFLQWKEGLRLLLVDDVKGSHHSSGGGSSNNPVHTEKGGAGTADGRGYQWHLETTDGKTAKFRINGNEFDLTKGTLFALKAKGEQVEVQQLVRDLAGIPFDAEGCKEFLKKDAEIQKIFAAGDAAK
jgi:hypothetical protein